MHELSIAVSLVEAVCDELPNLGPGVAVVAVRLRVGPLSGVVPEALTFAFEIAAAETPLARTRLDIERTDGRELELTALEIIDDAADS